MKLVECVPNFSEGLDSKIINEICNSVKSCNVNVLDVDSGKDTNRTVFTFVGSPDNVINAAYNVIESSSKLIDMNKHSGEHPRMGATDVCPFVPIKNVTMKDCIEYSKKLGRMVGNKLKIPVYLYENSATKKYRSNLADIRKGEFEGMADKLSIDKWKPDYGPNKIHPTAGVVAIGARDFLIAYNVNLNTTDKKIATDIALDIREMGRAKRDKKGKIIRDKFGKMIKKKGKLKSVKAVGWYLEEFKQCQVSMNLTKYSVNSLHHTFEEIRIQARKRGVRVTGSEIVGLVPLKPIIMAADFYLESQNRHIGIPEKDKIDITIKSLGLSELSKFNAHESIVEYSVNKSNSLSTMRINEFCDEVSIESPAPGGGSVSALLGALGGALVSMVGALSYNKKGYEKNNSKYNKISLAAQKLKDDLLNLIDLDSEAFYLIMNAFRLPKKTDKQIEARDQEILLATKTAIDVPLDTMIKSLDVIKLSNQMMKIGNLNSLSDVGVASESAYSAFNGALLNVKINLSSLSDEIYKDKINKKCNTLIEKAKKEISLSRDIIKKKM